MPLTQIPAYLTTNNAYNTIVIPATNQFFHNPTQQMIAEFEAKDADFLDWSGDEIDCIPVDTNLTESEIAELFGEIVKTRYC